MSFTFDLTGKRAFVTGGSRGLGRQMALSLALAGADVALVARPSDALEETADEIRAIGSVAWTLEADMGEPSATEAVCQSALSDIGSFDILITTSAGVA